MQDEKELLADLMKELKAREAESEILQALNADFAFIREKKELLRIIHAKLKHLFEFRHQWVATINEDELTMSSFMREQDSKAKGHPRYEEVIRAKYPITDRIFNKVLLSRDPFVFDLTLLSARGDMPEYLQILLDSGISKVVMIGLPVGTTVIGIWAICLLENQHMDLRQLDLIRRISCQLAIAVANFKANEAIKAREAEKEHLLQFSFGITTIRNKSDLLHILNRDLRYLFKFEHVTILAWNGSQNMPAFLLSTDRHEIIDAVSDESGELFQYQDDCFNRVKRTNGVVIFDMDQLLQCADPPAYVHAEYRLGIREKVAVVMRDDHEIIGVLYVNSKMRNSYSEHELQLIRGISYQLSTAVSKILANDEFDRRESERELLLSLSINIASVRDQQELLSVIRGKLKPVLSFSHSVLVILNEEQTSIKTFLLDPHSKCVGHPLYKVAWDSVYALNDGVIEKTFTSPHPLSFDLEILREQQQLPLYLEMNWDCGVKQLCVARFSRSNEVFGFWLMFFDRRMTLDAGRMTLIAGLANQLSVAVANIIANEKVAGRLHAVNHDRQQLEEEKIYLKEEIESSQNYADIVGQSASIQRIFKMVGQVAPSDSTVLILGETGTGKELIARAIHNTSPRKAKLMIKVNCAALPANLIESELFGHERGSFTGAMERRIGKFELANGGTLFLDEIGEMPLELQVKLLRALQEKEIERVGGKTTIKVDVRIIAATNRDLEKEMVEGRFRSDLYYRLNIFPIQLPPLRQRKEDIPLLANHFIRRFAKKAGRRIENFSAQALQELVGYDWPGNIREMEHFIERSILLTTGETIRHIHLPTPRQVVSPNVTPVRLKTIDENEREHILAITKYCHGRIAGAGGAAEILGVPPSTLNSRMKRLGIKKEHISR
jgi:transcriptional regulator with GAF, ATPase, and Fis domain